jgi:hypothetical protein
MEEMAGWARFLAGEVEAAALAGMEESEMQAVEAVGALS